MIRARSIVVTLSLLSLVAASGCAKKPKTSAEVRLPGNGFATAGGSTTGSQWGPNGAPGLDGANTGLNSSLAAGSGASSWDQSGSLANNGNLDGVGGASELAALAMIHFDYDSAELKPETQQTLDGHASWLASNAAISVQVEGHCDERGTEEYNLALGQRRADVVREYLVSKGIEPTRLSTISYGKLRPLTFDQNEEANAINRRAMFLGYTPEQGVSTAANY